MLTVHGSSASLFEVRRHDEQILFLPLDGFEGDWSPLLSTSIPRTGQNGAYLVGEKRRSTEDARNRWRFMFWSVFHICFQPLVESLDAMSWSFISM